MTTPYPTHFADERVVLTPLPVITERPSRPNASATGEPNGTQPSINHVDSTNSVIQSVVPEIKKFGGDPLEYRRFVRQFQAKVVANTDDDDERMNYLEQLTHSDAHKVVSGFSHLRGDRAYNAAMRQLEDRNGDDDVIASAFISKALNWPSVRAM